MDCGFRNLWPEGGAIIHWQVSVFESKFSEVLSRSPIGRSGGPIEVAGFYSLCSRISPSTILGNSLIWRGKIWGRLSERPDDNQSFQFLEHPSASSCNELAAVRKCANEGCIVTTAAEDKACQQSYRTEQ